MSVSVVLLVAALVFGAGVTCYRAWLASKKPNASALGRHNLQLLMEFVVTAVTAVEQEFRNSTLPKDQLNAARKARAVELTVAYARQLGLSVDPNLITLIAGVIESAVLRMSKRNPNNAYF